jgi:PucR-like helix-turn-helix protein
MTRTIEDLLHRFGADVTVAVPPDDPSVPVSSIAVWDGTNAETLNEEAVVFGVGGSDGAREDLFSAARKAGCAGVVLREPRDASTRAEWTRQARLQNVPLLLLEPAASWLTAIYSVSEQLNSDSGPGVESRSDDTAGDVPPGDLFALADAFADMVGGPVIVEDAGFRVLAYSSFTGAVDEGRNTAILGRRIPPEWLEYLERSGSLDRLRTTSEVIDLRSGPWHAHRRLITAVRSSTRLLGILWAAEGDHPLAADAGTALRRAAALAVPHLIRYQEGHRVEREWRGRLVRSLLDGRGHLQRFADELGLPRRARFAVLAFAPVSAGSLDEETWDRVTDHVALSCEAFRWHAAVARVGRSVFSILALPEDQSADGALRLGRDIVSRPLPTLRGGLSGAMSTIGPGLGKIKQRRIEAEDALSILREATSRDQRSFVAYAEVQAQVILRELSRFLAERTDLRLPGLQMLREEDERRGSDYLRTLRTYLCCSGNAREAAQRLDIHVTTLRYRLTRIKEISGLAIDADAVRLACRLLLEAMDV